VSDHGLLRDVSRQADGRYQIFIDNRLDSYRRRDEVLELTTNYYLRRSRPDEHVVRVQRADTREHLILQCADTLTGATTAVTNRARGPNFPMNDDRTRLSARLAELRCRMALSIFGIFRPSSAVQRVVVSSRRGAVEAWR
jgi:hypothetical protein